MTSQTLREARKYEEASAKLITEEKRPSFHLSARTGWMNDPNGFSYYKGQYHMFYQYYPYDVQWGPMHWGHAVSKDLCIGNISQPPLHQMNFMIWMGAFLEVQ